MSTTATLNLLEYSNLSQDASGWRSIFFKLSSRTLLFALLTIAATAWLSLHHEPWRRITTFPIADGQITLTSSGNLLSVSRDWADLYDGATGRTMNSILLNANFSGDRVAQSGDQFLVVPGNSTVATLMDLRSGSLQQLQVPVSNPKDVNAIAADPPRVLAGGADRRLAGVYELLPLLPTAATPPTGLQIEAFWIDFSPDGRRILTLDPRRDPPDRRAKLNLVDGLNGQVIAGPIIPSEVTSPGIYFASPNWLQVPTSGGTGNLGNIDIYSATTGRRTRSIQITNTGIIQWGTLSISDDGKLVTRLILTGPTITLQVFDTTTGAPMISRATRLPPTFFPNSHRLLSDVITPTSRQLVVIDPTQEQPLAVLADSQSSSKPSIRPDAQMLAIKLAGKPPQASIYQKAGWDCPESPWGAFAFPQTWLTVVCFTAMTLSLFRDARRGARLSAKNIPIAMLAVALPLTLHALLAACLGRWTLTPAPLLFLAAIGLATGARAWRWTTLLLLAANLPLCLYLARRVQQTNLRASTRYQLLDRFHEIPNVLPFIALLAASALIVIALPLLARPKATLIA